MNSLQIKNLKVSVEGKKIIHDLSLTIRPGEVHAIMGPNGSGKSSLAQALIGNTKFGVGSGEVLLDGQNILKMKVDERARAGLFLGFQYPREIEGVRISTFLKAAYETNLKLKSQKSQPEAGLPLAEKLNTQYKPLLMMQFMKILEAAMEKLQINREMAQRYLNQGFSGGEKKKMEILQMTLLDPKYVILDEIDSGLDIDALRVIAEGINNFRSSEKGLLLITHYDRILKQVKPDFVHIMIDGQIVKSGGAELADEVEKDGYDRFKL